MVEVGGIEPPSEGTPSPVLHAYPTVGSRPAAARWAKRTAGPACFRLTGCWQAATPGDSVIMTLRCEHGHKQFQGLRLKRRERSCRRWQL